MRKLFKKSLACCLALALLLSAAVTSFATETTTAQAAVAVELVIDENRTTATATVDITSDAGIAAIFLDASSNFGALSDVVLEDTQIHAKDADGNALYYDETVEGGMTTTPNDNPVKEPGGFSLTDDGSGFADGKIILLGSTVDEDVLSATLILTFTADAAVADDTYTVTIAPADEVSIATWDEVAASFTEATDTVELTSAPEVPEVTVTFANTVKSLNLAGLLSMNLTFTFASDALVSDADAKGNLAPADVLANAGILVWKEADYTGDPATAILGTESYSKNEWTQTADYGGYHEYRVITDGFMATEYNDTVYYRPYYILDGEYQYGDVYEYSVITYCVNQFKKTNESLKKLLVALLNYGAAAQTNFNYKTDALVNADLASYVELYGLNEEYLNVAWDESYITALVEPTAEMTVNFAADAEAAITAKSLRLEGEVAINFTHWADPAIVNDIVSKSIYCWSGADYNALLAKGEALTRENATYTTVAEKAFAFDATYGWEATEASMGISSNVLGDTVYCAFVYTTSDGTEYCTGITTYSAEYYASRKIGGSNTNLSELCKALVFYSEFAKAHFG